MPTHVATLTKANVRRLIADRNGGANTFTTTGAGSTTTLVISALAGYGADQIVGRWCLLTAVGLFRRAVAFDTSTGTITVPNAYGSGTGSGVTVEIHQIRPNLVTRAFNDAAPAMYDANIFRLVNSHVIPNTSRQRGGGNTWYAMPRNMRNITRITVIGDLAFSDTFDRADSTSEPGNGWVETTGTTGISSERFYFISDTDADKAHRPEKLKDGVIQTIVRGTLNSGSTYRSPAIIFRQGEDYANALDASNYLVLRLLNGVVDLRKVDAGSESSLTTATQTTADGTDYQLRVDFRGPNIQVWVDDVQLINYNLTGLNLKYAQNERYGLRLDKAGSPATDARVDDFFAFAITSSYEWRDWAQTRDSTTFELPAFGSMVPDGLLWVEGTGQLSLLDEDDTTAQALDTDSTATIEIALTDPALGKFLTMIEAELYELQAKNVDTDSGQLTITSAQYERMADRARARARGMAGMPWPGTAKMRGVQA